MEVVDKPCSLCGILDNPDHYIESNIRDIMVNNNYCFRCALWANKVVEDSEDKSIIPLIVDHHHWSFPILEPVYFSQQRTAVRPLPNMYYILMEDGRIYTTNQLWHQGEIPKYFWNQLPNNAIFITFEEYSRVLNLLGPSTICPQPLLNFLLKKYNFTK